MSVVSEQVGQGSWEAARFPEHSLGIYSRFLCGIVVGDKRLTGILLINRYEKGRLGELLIPMRATNSSRLAVHVESNRSCFANPKDYGAIAEELGLVFHRVYAGEVQVSSLSGGNPDKLGVQGSLTVSNRSPGSVSEASEPGDIGAAIGLAQHIMDTLPGGWRITPEPVISR